MGLSHASLLFLCLLLLNNKEEEITFIVPIPSKASSSLRSIRGNDLLPQQSPRPRGDEIVVAHSQEVGTWDNLSLRGRVGHVLGGILSGRAIFTPPFPSHSCWCILIAASHAMLYTSSTYHQSWVRLATTTLLLSSSPVAWNTTLSMPDMTNMAVMSMAPFSIWEDAVWGNVPASSSSSLPPPCHHPYPPLSFAKTPYLLAK
jgi:hypothetical protein